MNLELDLRAALVPVTPGPQLRATVNARLAASRGRRGLFRPLLFGVLAAAAAAAMFGVYQRGVPPQQTVAISSAEPAQEPLLMSAGGVDAAPGPASGIPPEPVRVVVQLDALQIQGENLEVRTELREFYDTMEAGLRAIPGLKLIQAGHADAPDAHADFRLTIMGQQGQGRWHVRSRLQRPERPGAFQMMIAGSNLPSICANLDARPVGMCVPAAQLAGEQVNQFRLDLLPGDVDFRRGLRAKVLDASETFANRFVALELLSRKARGDMDAAIIRAALDLIAAAPHPHGIERLLDMLRGHADPALLAALIDMAYQHPAPAVRARALSILIDEHKSSPTARSAIESLAAADRMPVLTHVAERAISGDAGWNEYVLATVSDPTLTPAQRFAPLAYLMQTEQKDDVRQLLDDDFVTMLKDVLPGVVGGRDESAALSAFGVMALVPDASTPAAIDLMLAIWDGASMVPYRAIAIDPLLMHRQDPRVREKLEAIAAGDADPQLRERASVALQSI